MSLQTNPPATEEPDVKTAPTGQIGPVTSEAAPKSYLRLRVSWVIAALSCLCVSFLTAVVVVAAVQGADALSTVALALAVLAFAAQLVLSVSQEMTSAQQYHQTASINAQTLEALAEIRVATGESLERRDHQFSRLLETVLPPALARSFAEQEDVPVSVDLDELSRRLVQAARTELDRDAGASEVEQSTGVSRRSEVDSLLAARPKSARLLRSFPPREQLTLWRTIAETVEELSQLRDDELESWLREAANPDGGTDG